MTMLLLREGVSVLYALLYITKHNNMFWHIIYGVVYLCYNNENV